MVSAPLQRYRFILKFRPHQALNRLKVHKRWDKNMNAVTWVCYKATKIRWREHCWQPTRSKTMDFTEMRDFQFKGWTKSAVRAWLGALVPSQEGNSEKVGTG